MNYAIRLIAGAAVLVLFSGCSSLSDMRANEIGAEPLSVKPEELRNPARDISRKDYLGALAYESQLKCDAFLKRLVSSLQTLNATGDVATTIFSALGTVFTPISTVHGLTAASAISSGTKNSLLTDLYAKASVANFQVAIQQRYSTEINQYVAALPSLNDSNILLSAEVSKIQSIHSLCGIAQAEATIAATLSPAAPKTSPITVQKSFNPATVAVNTPSVLTITLGNTSGNDAALTAPFVDKLPSGLTIAATPNLAGNCQPASVVVSGGGGTITFNSGATVPNNGCTISVSVTASKADTYTNRLDANALQTNQGNSAEASATLQVTTASAAPGPTLVPSAGQPAPAPPPTPSPAPAQTTRGAIWGQPLR